MSGDLVNGGVDALISRDLNSTTPGRYDFQVRGGVVVGTAPEPGELLLIAGGLLALGLYRRRRPGLAS